MRRPKRKNPSALYDALVRVSTLRTVAERPLRRDAASNRDRLLAAATAAIKRSGYNVALSSIAADAGVGVGTLYRRYPNREALLAALMDRSFRLVLSAVQRAASSEATGLDMLGNFLEQTIEQRGELILPLHGSPAPPDATMNALRAEIRTLLEEILARGRRDGTVRDDAGPADIVLMGAMLAEPLANVEDWDRLARRQMSIYLDGLRPRP